MRMDGVARYRPGYDVKLLSHPWPRSLCFMDINRVWSGGVSWTLQWILKFVEVFMETYRVRTGELDLTVDFGMWLAIEKLKEQFVLGRSAVARVTAESDRSGGCR